MKNRNYQYLCTCTTRRTENALLHTFHIHIMLGYNHYYFTFFISPRNVKVADMRSASSRRIGAAAVLP